MNIPDSRLHHQRIEGRPLKRAVDVVRWLCASQAQDFAGAKWALGLRARGITDVDVDDAFNSGEILRTHLLRPTWHVVTKDDIRWMLELTAPQVHKVNGPRYRALELDPKTLEKTTKLLGRALEGGQQLTRDELRAALARARIDTTDQRMAYMLMHAELEAVICSGPRRGKQFTYALLDERAPRTRKLPRNEALTELARRYFATRGPATVHDFAKWSGLSLSDARTGLDAVADTLKRIELDGVTYWSARARTRTRGQVGPIAHLISIYDEYLSSYRDRSAICEPAYAKRLVGMGAALAYVLIVDGKVTGTWKRTISNQAVHIRVTPFRKLNSAEQRALALAAQRYADFLGVKYLLT